MVDLMLPQPVDAMEMTLTVLCPYCGQENELSFDTSISEQDITTDCEVCCRPFEVAVQCEPGRILAVQVQ